MDPFKAFAALLAALIILDVFVFGVVLIDTPVIEMVDSSAST